MASRAAYHFSPCMLPLVSRTMPRLTGVRSDGEVRDLDRLVVFEHDEVFLGEALQEASRAIGHGGGHVDELHAAAEAKPFLPRDRNGGVETKQHGERGDSRRGTPGVVAHDCAFCLLAS